MKTGIDRALIWFRDGENDLEDLNDKYYPISLLLNRLMNERYDGNRIEFINILFSSERTYELYPSEKYCAHYYGGHLNYDDVFDFEFFNKSNEEAKKEIIWEAACKALKDAAKKIQNTELLDAAQYTFDKGISLGLDPNYSLLSTSCRYKGDEIEATLDIDFSETKMLSVLRVKNGDKMIFTQNIDSAEVGMEFFLEMYTKLEIDQKKITLKGKKDIEYLPLVIPLDAILSQR